MSIFSDRLKWLREQNSFTQKEMSEMLGMSQPGYQKIEYGQREMNFETLSKLPTILGVSIDFLLGVTDIEKHLKDLIDEYKFILKDYEMRKEKQIRNILNFEESGNQSESEQISRVLIMRMQLSPIKTNLEILYSKIIGYAKSIPGADLRNIPVKLPPEFNDVEELDKYKNHLSQ